MKGGGSDPKAALAEKDRWGGQKARLGISRFTRGGRSKTRAAEAVKKIPSCQENTGDALVKYHPGNKRWCSPLVRQLKKRFLAGEGEWGKGETWLSLNSTATLREVGGRKKNGGKIDI